MWPLAVAGVSGGDDDNYASGGGTLRGLVNDALRAGHVIVAAERAVERADVLSLAVLDAPLYPSRNRLLCDSPSLAHPHEHQRRLVCDAAVEAVGEMTVARGRNRCLRSVPVPNLRRRAERRFFASDVEEG